MSKEYFPEIGKIKYEGPSSYNPMAYRYYDAERVVLGKKMKDWLRFAMAWWHTLCAEGADQFGGGTHRPTPWNELRPRPTPVSKSWRSSASSISASTTWTL